jgi:hypothetical protein
MAIARVNIMPISSTPSEIVTLSLFRYPDLRSRWWAFTQMGLGPGRFRRVAGLRTAKLLGSGGGNGFSIRPNWGVYGLLQIWRNEEAAQRFFAEDHWWQGNARRASEIYTVFMRTAMVHGQWSGEAPFQVTTELQLQRPLAVITRATIKTRHLLHFWRYVPTVSASIEGQRGRMLSVGIGEWPLFMQATFSLWRSGKAMMDYAYQSAHHREVIQRTRELGWYKEELFARFHPYASSGSWEGADPLAACGIAEQ